MICVWDNELHRSKSHKCAALLVSPARHLLTLSFQACSHAAEPACRTAVIQNTQNLLMRRHPSQRPAQLELVQPVQQQQGVLRAP